MKNGKNHDKLHMIFDIFQCSNFRALKGVLVRVSLFGSSTFLHSVGSDLAPLKSAHFNKDTRTSTPF